MNTPQITIGDRLLLAMAQENISQAALARGLKISRSAINQLCRGSVKGMHPQNLLRACRYLRIRPEWLVLGEEPMRAPPTLRLYPHIPPEKQALIDSMVQEIAGRYS